MATQKIELLKPWGMHTKGTILTLDTPVTSLLIGRGAARAVETPAAKPQIKLQPHVKRPNG